MKLCSRIEPRVHVRLRRGLDIVYLSSLFRCGDAACFPSASDSETFSALKNTVAEYCTASGRIFVKETAFMCEW